MVNDEQLGSAERIFTKFEKVLAKSQQAVTKMDSASHIQHEEGDRRTRLAEDERDRALQRAQFAEEERDEGLQKAQIAEERDRAVEGVRLAEEERDRAVEERDQGLQRA